MTIKVTNLFCKSGYVNNEIKANVGLSLNYLHF